MSELLKIRDKLAEEKMNLQQNLADLGMSKNFSYKMRGTSDNPVWETRKTWVNRIMQIDKELRDINKDIHIANKSMDDQLKMAKNIIKEVFGMEVMVEIFEEVRSRLSGGHPMKISVAYPKKDGGSYKKELLEVIDTMFKARETINSYIATNEPEINKAEYFGKMAKLNKCLPSISEIDKLKSTIIKPANRQ